MPFNENTQEQNQSGSGSYGSGAGAGTAGTSGGAASGQNANQFFSNYTDIQAQVNQVGNSYINFYWDRKSWLQNPANGPAIAMAVDELGMPPAVRDPYSWRNNYNTWCLAFGPLVNLYELAFLFKKYDIPQQGAPNFCRQLKALLFTMDDEQIAADRLHVANPSDDCGFFAKTQAINILRSKIQDLYNDNTCEFVIQNENAQNQIAQNQQLQDHSTELQWQQQQNQARLAAEAATNAAALQKQLNASNAADVANVAGTGLKGTNSFMVYGILAAVGILLVGAVVVFKKKSE